MLNFSTFWHGDRLSSTEWACLSSFTRRGYKVNLYSYTDLGNVPMGITARKAEDIVSREYLDKFVVQGKPSIAHFSDYFRLKLFERESTVWIDNDVILLKDFIWDENKRFFAKESANSICNAILYFPRNDPILPAMITNVESMLGRPIEYGETGKDLIFKHIGFRNVLKEAQATSLYYPIHYDEFWKPLLPEFFDECEQACSQAITVHLWNNLYEKTGLWKEIAPPEGSFLSFLLKKFTHMNFEKTYPHNVVRQAIRNYFHLDMGLHTLVKRFKPAIINTYNRKLLGEYKRNWK